MNDINISIRGKSSLKFRLGNSELSLNIENEIELTVENKCFALITEEFIKILCQTSKEALEILIWQINKATTYEENKNFNKFSIHISSPKLSLNKISNVNLKVGNNLLVVTNDNQGRENR
ncbi:CLUMA_CG021587, isoform A [Clunio marinus]|uniref:CLUMA_CG021587, isoform A n=1 Tax=Clunio marinus TaxID=568069 RepID=A0A1J1J8F5_9DIPT|nr:CLUMA_CG021587, isoform A [Clunio marinus]